MVESLTTQWRPISFHILSSFALAFSASSGQSSRSTVCWAEGGIASVPGSEPCQHPVDAVDAGGWGRTLEALTLDKDII